MIVLTISAQGQLRFMLTKGRVTAAVFIEFLKRLLINPTFATRLDSREFC